MKKYIPIALLILCSCLVRNHAIAETFPELNVRLTAGVTKDKLKQEMRREDELFRTTNDSLHLFKSKLIETFIFSNVNRKRLKTLVWLEQNSGRYKSVNVIACFHIAYLFESVGAHKLSQKYGFKLDRMISRNSEFRAAITQLIASNYFAEEDYENARKNYQKAIRESANGDYLNRSSNYNNVALTYLKQKQYDKAETYFRKAFSIISNHKEKSSYEKHFLYVVEGNIGTICYYQKKYDEALVLLEKELNHCLYGESERNEIISPLTQLLDIYTIRKNTAKEKYILTIIDSLIREEYTNSKTYAIYLKILIDHAVATNDLVTVNKLSPILLRQIELNNKQINELTSELTNILYEDRFEQYSNESATQKRLLTQALSSKKLSQLLLGITLFIGILIISMLIVQYRNKQKTLIKDRLILDQQRQLLSNEKTLLERENQLQLEKITSLAMNLSIKKETEKVFLNKLNEIKRKKSIDTVEVIQELQLIVNNLLNIDEKMIQGTIEANQIDQKYKLNLQKLHPELTNEDIQFCCYFKLKLSAKEIGSIQGLSDVSVRVMKNKIKRKMGLSTHESLNSYLNQVESMFDPKLTLKKK
jgi:tetratricopeptide (TPR) repeat protein